MVGLVISLSITAGSIFFIFYRVTSTATIDSGAAIIDSASYFDGATVIDPPRQLADFTLAGNDGNPLHLSDLYGKVTLVYFGYTNCPDFCPITLGDFMQVKALLNEKAEDVNFLMVSVEGTIDTPDRMRRYLGEFDPDFLGMTGAEEEVKRIGVDFGLYFAENETDEQLVDHTSSIFMVDQQGALRTVFTYGTEPEVMAEDIDELLA
jgi:protein SCO1/2